MTRLMQLRAPDARKYSFSTFRMYKTRKEVFIELIKELALLTPAVSNC